MRTIIYATLVRLWGNKTPHNQLTPHGTLEQNGSGTLEDIDDDALDYLASLGTTHLWSIGIIRHATKTPLHTLAHCPEQHPDIVKGVAGSPYAITDYYDVHPTIVREPIRRKEIFRSFLERCHRHGLKVIIDFVPNHLSRQYDGAETPEGTLRLGAADDKTKAFAPNNNFYYLPSQSLQLPNGSSSYCEEPARVTGNDCWSSSPSANDWYETVKLNYGVDYRPDGSRVTHFDTPPATWLQMRDILCYWAEQGVDGFRCDMVELVPIEFWHWAIPQVQRQYPVTFIAEIYQRDNYRRYLDEGAFDLLYDKSGLYDTLYQVVTQECSVSTIESQIIANNATYAPDELLYFLENHDEVRLASSHFAHTAERGLTAMTLLALATSAPLLLYGGQEYGERATDGEGYSGYDGRTSIFDYWTIPSLVDRDPSNPIYRSYAELMTRWAQHPVILRGNFCTIQEQARAWGGFNTDRTYGYLRLLPREEPQAGATVGIAVLCNFTADLQRYPLFIPAYGDCDESQQLMQVRLHTPQATPRELLYAFQPWAPLSVELAPYSVQIVELRPYS